MILYMWAIGIIFTISVFAIKVGLWAWVYTTQRLGLLMLGIGGYFFLAILVMPAYLEAKKIYTLAINQTNQSYDFKGTGIFILLVFLFLALGFIQKKRELNK